MTFELPELPYAMDALEPQISKETLEYHYGKHHQTYVNTLNSLVKRIQYEHAEREEIAITSSGDTLDNAAKVPNHTFYWNCLAPNAGGEPGGALAQAINDKWGSFEEFKTAFNTAAAGNFGSGWTWLVKKQDGSVDIVNTSNADTPLPGDDVPLLP